MTVLAPPARSRLIRLWQTDGGVATPRQDALGVALGLWLVSGVFIDGWAHAGGSVDTFFTPWHAILYGGATAVFGWFAWLAWQRQGVPHGYRGGVAAAPIFLVGGALDFGWHAVFGIEENLNALLSPTHLLLFLSGLLVLSTPWRASARRGRGERIGWGPTLSLYLTAVLTSFFLLYTSPFAYGFAATAFRALPESAPDHQAAQLPAIAGLGGYLVTTLLLVVPLLVLLRRGDPPPGAATALLVLVAGGASVTSRFEQPYALAAALAAGVAVDAALAVFAGSATRRALAAAAALPLVLWPVQLLGLALSDAVRWPAELTSGVVLLSVGAALAAAWVASAGGRPVPAGGAS